jgi:hypothetical protein
MIDDKLIGLLIELERSSPMRCEVVDSAEAMQEAVDRHLREGRRLASVSNAGLEPPQRRLTFLPSECFTREKGDG